MIMRSNMLLRSLAAFSCLKPMYNFFCKRDKSKLKFVYNYKADALDTIFKFQNLSSVTLPFSLSLSGLISIFPNARDTSTNHKTVEKSR